jgi:hypothetical protein
MKVDRIVVRGLVWGAVAVVVLSVLMWVTWITLPSSGHLVR